MSSGFLRATLVVGPLAMGRIAAAQPSVRFDPRVPVSALAMTVPPRVQRFVDDAIRSLDQRADEQSDVSRCEAVSEIVSYIPPESDDAPGIWLGVGCRGTASSPYTPPLWQFVFVLDVPDSPMRSLVLQSYWLEPVRAASVSSGAIRLAFYVDDYVENHSTRTRRLQIVDVSESRSVAVLTKPLLEECCWLLRPCKADSVAIGSVDIGAPKPAWVESAHFRRSCSHGARWIRVNDKVSPAKNRESSPR